MEFKVYNNCLSKVFSSTYWITDSTSNYKIFQDYSIATKASTININNKVTGMRLLLNKLLDELQVNFNIIRCSVYSIALVVNAGLEKVKFIISPERSEGLYMFMKSDD